VVQAIKDQADRLLATAPQHAVGVRSEAARLITEHLPGDRLTKVFFTNGGTEAIENAVRMARLHTGKHKVLAAYRSYHGHTATAMALTGEPRRWATDLGTAGVSHFFGPYLYRSPFDATTQAQECERALAHLDQVIRLEGPSTLAAVVLESVVGSAGILVPPAGYLAGVRRLCTEHGLLLVLDEVMAGFGRTGRWFGYQLDGQDGLAADPDLVTFAKGVNSGYVPMGGVAISDEVAATFDSRPYPGGLTYSGHPLGAAAAVATIELMERDGIVEHAARIGTDVLGPALHALAEEHQVIGDVRGTGVFWGVELVADRETREPVVPYAAAGPATKPITDLMGACRRRGLLPFLAGNRVHVVPPCTVSEDEARYGVALLGKALGEVFG